MRFSIERNALLHVLTSVTKVVESRNTMPILGNVALIIDQGQLTVRGTDLDIEVTASLPLMDAEDGAITVPAKLLTDIVKKAGTELSLATEPNKLTIKSGRSRFSLPTLPVDDLPTLAAGAFDAEFDVDLSAIVSPVAFAMSTEETRYYLKGVHLHTIEGQLVAVATDGHRLARQNGQEAPAFEGIILPAKLVNLLPKGTVKFAVSNTKVRITTDDATITSKLIDGTFPDYRRVIPSNNDNRLKVKRDDLLQAAERVAVVADNRRRAVKLSITADAVALELRYESNVADDSIVASYDGEPMSIGFNGQYLGDAMRAFDGGEVVIALADSGSPAVVTGSNEGLLVVLMPMRF